jgi:tRNA-binding EMAP/Myf-like protein
MKFTLSWLKNHLDTTASVAEVCAALNKIGLEVEAAEDKAAVLAAFTIARVIEAKQHPNADRLRVCMVDTGAGEPVQVVCGAPNARTGMKSVFSPPGTYIPGKDITLGKGVIRGVESNGMLCSSAELELSNDHDGIIDLPDDAPVGMAYAAWAGLDDPVIEIAVTPNRADRRILRQVDDPVMILGELQFRRRAEHAVRFDAADHALAERDILAGNIGSGRREDALHAGARIGRAADDLHRLAGAGVHHADPQPVGIGMLLRFDHRGDGEIAQLRRRIGDAFDLKADLRQRLGDRRQRGVGVEMVLEPGEGEFHVSA